MLVKISIFKEEMISNLLILLMYQILGLVRNVAKEPEELRSYNDKVHVCFPFLQIQVGHG